MSRVGAPHLTFLQSLYFCTAGQMRIARLSLIPFSCSLLGCVLWTGIDILNLSVVSEKTKIKICICTIKMSWISKEPYRKRQP